MDFQLEAASSKALNRMLPKIILTSPDRLTFLSSIMVDGIVRTYLGKLKTRIKLMALHR